MLKKFLQDFGTFKAGDVRDYPLQTWRQIATTAKVPLKKLAEDVVAQPKAAAPRAQAMEVAHG